MFCCESLPAIRKRRKKRNKQKESSSSPFHKMFKSLHFHLQAITRGHCTKCLLHCKKGTGQSKRAVIVMVAGYIVFIAQC